MDSNDQTSSRIQVIARVRPLFANEIAPVVYVKTSDEISHISSSSSSSSSTPSSKSSPPTTIIGVDLSQELTATKGSKEYSLDQVFGESVSQAKVFEGVTPLIRAALSGFNTTIFTYGQTGTGKTHTMLGHDLWELASNDDPDNDDDSIANSFKQLNSSSSSRDARGIIPRALQYVFKQIRVMVEHASPNKAPPDGNSNSNNDANANNNNNIITVSVSYTEIYNEKVRDLLHVSQNQNDTNGNGNSNNDTDNITVMGTGAAALTPSKAANTKGSFFGVVEAEQPSLDIREDKKLGIVIPNLTEITVGSEEEVSRF